MSIYYGQRASTLQRVYEKIEDVCKRHVAVAEFDLGDLQQFNEDYSFPLVYLETITEMTENEAKNCETFNITINVLDRQPDAADRASMRQTHDKLKQVFNEIKMYFERKEVFGNKNVGPASVLLFNDFDDASLVRLRGEFSLQVELEASDVPDLKLIFRDPVA